MSKHLSKRLVLLPKDFEKPKAHSISLELQLQNQSLTSGLSERFLKKSSDVANMKKDIDDIETINIEKYMFNNVHDACLSKFVNDMNSRDKWRPTGRIFLIDDLLDTSATLVDTKIPVFEKEITSNPLEPSTIRFPKPTSLLGRFGNDHVAAIQAYGDLQWENILITRVYYVEGADLLSGTPGTNLYTINLHEMTSSSLICLMTRDTSINYWL
ncbi:hypothetical protein Tco_0738858 [Tanacetum coccineum]